jgi:hypothetical protein
LFSSSAPTSVHETWIRRIVVSVFIENSFLPVRTISFLASPVRFGRPSRLLCIQRRAVGRIGALTISIVAIIPMIYTVPVIPIIPVIPVVAVIAVVAVVAIIPVISIIAIWVAKGLRGNKSRYHEAQEQ